MSRDSQDEHDYRNVPFDQHRDNEDDLRIASQPSFVAFSAPLPPTTDGLVPSRAAQAAAQFVQNPNTYQYPVPIQPMQSYPAQNFPAYCDPTHNQPRQHQFAQSQPGQLQPGQYQTVQLQPLHTQPEQGQPAQNFPPYCDPMHNQPGQHQVVQNQAWHSQPGQMQTGQIQAEPIQQGQYQALQIQPVQSQPQQVNLVQWHPTPSFDASLDDIFNWLRVPDILDQDWKHIQVRKRNVPEPKRACAEQLAGSRKFVEWLRDPAPSQLLVHANYEERDKISGMSLFCVSLMNLLGGHPNQFVPLVFFCGLHAERRDNPSSSEPPSTAGTHSLPSPSLSNGAHGLIRSFIQQLLAWYKRYHCVCFLRTFQEKYAVENNDLRALYGLFKDLVCKLPSGRTVCCLVDGAEYFERDRFWNDMEGVMWPLLELSASRPPPCPVIKVLFTSPTKTSKVRQWVAGRSILSMTELGRPGPASEARLETLLASALG